MSRAEERALEKYPAHKSVFDKYEKQRYAYICGYIQAEKDIEPTLEDVEIIINAFLDLCIENKEQGKKKRYTDKEYCQEVLKRFKEMKMK